MKKAYPVFIAENKGDYLVYAPDMDIYTEAKSLVDAIDMARDAICLTGIEKEDGLESVPEPSDMNAAKEITIEKADGDDFRYSTGICTLVDVDLTEYRKKYENYSVKKNCTIPYRLSVEAEKAGINYSKVLREALEKVLKDVQGREISTNAQKGL